MEDPTPRTLLERVGAWELGRTLGRGAYAHVRVAKHTVTGHEAACKILPALHRNPGRAITHDEMMDAIEAHKEVVLLKGLNGAKVPGVAGLEGVIEQDGWTYVFLTIYPHSASNFPLPWSHTNVIPFFRKLLTSLHYLHELDISHEDLKRSNILVDDNHEPILVDFGFSHFNPYHRLVKSLGGTLDYSSPEKARESRYDPRANDIWCLGILLTKLLGLSHPYSTEIRPDTSERLRQRITCDKPSISFTQTQVDLGIRKALRGMLMVDPKERWTIPQILDSRFFRSPTGNTKNLLFEAPSEKIATHTINILPDHVIQDLCFLAYLNNEFYLCETDLKIREKLRSKEPCWEKRWAKMLSKWSQREEMQWEDVPPPVKPKKASVRSKRAPLREIRVDNKSNLTPVKNTPVTPKSPYEKPAAPLGRKAVFSPKRKTRSVATMPLAEALKRMESLVTEDPEIGRSQDEASYSSEARSSSTHYEHDDPPATFDQEAIEAPKAAFVKVNKRASNVEHRIIVTRALARNKASEMGWPSDRATVGSQPSSKLDLET